MHASSTLLEAHCQLIAELSKPGGLDKLPLSTSLTVHHPGRAVQYGRRVLDMPEVLCRILTLLCHKEKAVVARISKRWSTQALDLLWEKLESALPLFELLVPLNVVSGSWVSHGSFRVRRCSLSFHSSSTLPRMFRLRTGSGSLAMPPEFSPWSTLTGQPTEPRSLLYRRSFGHSSCYTGQMTPTSCQNSKSSNGGRNTQIHSWPSSRSSHR